jgi:uncharacterized surface protein with fasciclin (FAS1) repeats
MTARAPRLVPLIGILAVLGLPLACSEDPADTAPTTTAGTVETTTPPTTAADAEIGPYDIVGTALEAVQFTQLAGMVIDAGLLDTLRSDGPFTVFAPTNDAFAALPVDALHDVQDDPELLATVLTYHVVPGALTLADLHDGSLTTVSGLDLEVSHDGDDVLINGIPVAAGDIEATNGIIHVMGGVLLPPS